MYIGRSFEGVMAITNQRETIIAWDSVTGKALCPCIVWMDVRTESIVERFKENEKDLIKVSVD